MEENTLFNKYGIVVDSGKVIFEENAEGDRMFIIQEGNVRISKTISGKPHILAVLGKGDFFGEMAIVNRVRRTATATAVGTVKLLAFDRPGFVGMIEKNARIGLNVIDKLCRRLQQANTQIQHLVKGNEKGLIALNLYYAFAEQGLEKAVLEIHKTARDISLSLEIPNENSLKYFQTLDEQGIIANDNGNLMLIDKTRLSALAESAGGNIKNSNS
jgi:CRP/FNR family transcriptional regulator, cyclic AMP receptor protein